MATSVHIPVEEYLRTVYRPDCDYVDGEVQERNLGEQYHSLMQSTFAILFGAHEEDWGLRVLTEQRVQVNASRYRVPDVCLVRDSDPVEPVLRTAPVLCIEILSPEDRFQRVHQRVREYQQMGVGHVWVIDPETREIWTAEGGNELRELSGQSLPVPGTTAELTSPQVFARIDRAQRA